MNGTPLWERAVNYGGVGATRAADLIAYPPAGYRPLEKRARLGHGEERWDYAWAQTLTWGIQRAAGFQVIAEEAPAVITEQSYTPVGFDDAGNPVSPAVVGVAGEQVFAPDGAALVRPGDTAWLGIRFWPMRFRFPARVVYVVDEPNRRGFAYGTLPGHAEKGEEAFIIDRTEDGSVFLTIRALSRPAHAGWWLVAPVLRIVQAFYTARYLRALAGPIPESAAGPGAPVVSAPA